MPLYIARKCIVNRKSADALFTISAIHANTFHQLVHFSDGQVTGPTGGGFRLSVLPYRCTHISAFAQKQLGLNKYRYLGKTPHTNR